MQIFIFIEEVSQSGMSGYEFLAWHTLQEMCILASVKAYLQVISKPSTVCNFCKTYRSPRVFIWYEFSLASRTAHCRTVKRKATYISSQHKSLEACTQTQDKCQQQTMKMQCDDGDKNLRKHYFGLQVSETAIQTITDTIQYQLTKALTSNSTWEIKKKLHSKLFSQWLYICTLQAIARNVRKKKEYVCLIQLLLCSPSLPENSKWTQLNITRKA